MSAAPMRLAAEPRRKYSVCGSLPSSLRDLSMKPVGCAASTRDHARVSMPSRASAAARKRPNESSPRRVT